MAVIGLNCATFGRPLLKTPLLLSQFVAKYISTIGVDFGVKTVKMEGLDVKARRVTVVLAHWLRSQRGLAHWMGGPRMGCRAGCAHHCCTDGLDGRCTAATRLLSLQLASRLR